jgi:hypothetical protein
MLEFYLAVLGLVILVLSAALYRGRKKLKQLQQQVAHEFLTVRHEYTMRLQRMESAHFQSLAGQEQIRYDSEGRDLSHDFDGQPSASWDYLNHRFSPDSGQGSHKIENNVISLERTNESGRYELRLKTYFFENVMDHIPANASQTKRHFHITGEVKKESAPHLLRFVFKSESKQVLDEKDYVVFNPDWERFDLYFTFDANEAFALRIDDLSVLNVPSRIEIKNLKLAEKC